MATGSSGGPRSKNSAKTCAPSPGSAGRTGTLQRPNSRPRGRKGERTPSTPTAKPMSKPSVNRTSKKPAIGFALLAYRVRLESGAKPQRVIDDDRPAPAFDQAFALHGVDLARH